MKKVFALLMAALLAVSILGCSDWEEPGKVFYLNCEPEANETWQKLATTYSDIYGVEVTVRTVSTEDCASAVRTALSWEEAPTAFQFRCAEDLERLKGNCLDFTGSAVLGQMITGSFNLTDGGAVKAICYSYDAFGLMVNTELLTSAGYDLADITDYFSLKAVAEDIHSRRDELGFDAFAAFAEDGSTAWQLAEMAQFYQGRDEDGTSLFRQVLDLYTQNSSRKMPRTLSDVGMRQFADGTAVFCQHSAAVYQTLLAEPYNMNSDTLAMVPVYCGAENEANAALCCAPRSYWAVNSQASAADRKATLDFLNWVVTSEYGISILQEQFGGVPFKNNSSKNGFYGTANTLLAQGKYPIIVLDQDDESRQAAIAAAVTEYTANQTDENWQKIRDAFDAERT